MSAKAVAVPRGWRSASPQHQTEFLRELHVDHVLFGRDAEVVAVCDGCDDVLVRTGEATWSRVHLTWSGKTERDARWPVVRHLAETWADALDDAERHAQDEHGD